MTDKALIRLLQSKQEQDRSKGISALILRFGPMIRNYVLQNSGQEADVRVHHMEVAFALYECVNKSGFILNKQTKLSTLYYAISQRLWLKKIRGRKNHLPILQEQNQEENAYIFKHFICAPSPVQEMIDADTQAEINALFENLCEDCKGILRDQYFHNYDYESIANRLGINTQSARNKAVKCRAKLKRLILKNERLKAYFKSYIKL